MRPQSMPGWDSQVLEAAGRVAGHAQSLYHRLGADVLETGERTLEVSAGRCTEWDSWPDTDVAPRPSRPGRLSELQHLSEVDHGDDPAPGRVDHHRDVAAALLVDTDLGGLALVGQQCG